MKPIRPANTPKPDDRQVVGVLGCENVSPHSSYGLLSRCRDIDLVLFGTSAECHLHELARLVEAMPLDSGSRARLSVEGDVERASIFIISSGTLTASASSIEDRAAENFKAVGEDGKFLRDNGFDGIILVTTSPAELMAKAVLETSGLDDGQVIGLGPGLGAQLSAGLDELPLATWCTVSSRETEYCDSCDPNCFYFEAMLERLHRLSAAVRQPFRSTASCVMQVCSAILSGEASIIPVAAMLHGEYGISGTFVTVPCVVGRRGVERVVELKLPASEREQLLDTARLFGRWYRRLERPDTVSARAQHAAAG